MIETMLLAAIFLVALLYATAGHGGASGYLAVMALFSVETAAMRPTALGLNLAVSAIALVRFRGAGAFSWERFWPFAVASVPAAYLGGSLQISPTIYQGLAGAVLLWAGARLGLSGRLRPAPPSTPHLSTALGTGAGIGLLSGIVGIGGGILLSPVLLLAGWADARVTAGVSAAFVLVNSLAGLAGQLRVAPEMASVPVTWIVTAAIAGWAGATLGSRHLSLGGLRRWLGIVLVVGGLKLLLQL